MRRTSGFTPSTLNAAQEKLYALWADVEVSALEYDTLEAALDTAQQDEIIAICRDFESLPNLAAGDVFAIANRRLS